MAWLAMIALGCAGPGGAPEPTATPAPVETLDGLRQQALPGEGAVFVRAAGADLGVYRAVQVDPPQLGFAPHSARPGERREERLREDLRATLARTLERSFGWEVVEEPDPDVLRVRSAVLDLDLDDPPVSAVRTTVYASPSGSVGFVLEVCDGGSGEALLRFGERRPLPGGTFVGPPWTELQRTREAFRRFSLDARDALLEVAAR